MEHGEIMIAAPPALPRASRAEMLVRLLPVALAAGMLAVLILGYRSGSAAARNPVFLALPALMLVSAAATALIRGGRADVDADRDDYLAYLAELRDEVTGIAAAQHDWLQQAYPDPAVLWTLIGSPAMWCRHPGDPHFGRVRVGLGAVPLAATLVAAQRDRVQCPDPVTDGALRCFLDTHASLPAAPVTVDLLGQRALRLGGDLARAMLCQLALSHGPDLVQLTAATDDRARQHWDWLKWLPHHRYSGSPGGHTVVVVDGVACPPPGPGRTIIEIAGTTIDAAPCPDRLTMIDALVFARRLAGQAASSPDRGWPALVGIDPPGHFDPRQAWARLDPGERLRVPIGTDDTGRPVRLDLNEAAAGGSGPHGLCIGATGSGKSELLRTLVLGLLARHSPDQLNLVLVDFKGGATFAGMACAHHVAAVITNLADDAPLVDRMRDTLAGELHRRQELLRDAGDFAGIADYDSARRAGAALDPLPTLLIIVDEFTELLCAHPDFIDTFVAIGRLGRSLGMHLLLASQRLDEGRLRGLESHLSYRVCLKTLSDAESRLTIGVPDAHQLPNTPGVGYLRTADGQLRRFRAAYVSGPLTEQAPTVRIFTGAPTATPAGGRALLDTVLAGLAGHGPPARRIWLPPLERSPQLHTLTDTGLPELVVPIGVVDRPYQQRRTPLLADLRGAAGHVAVVGAPQSGKSTALATLITALAVHHAPDRIRVYGLDFGGGTLTALATLPHVGSVAGRGAPELVRRIVTEMEAIIERREADSTHTDRPDIFLVIDGWAGLCRDFDDLAEPILALAGRGLSHGVHLVITAARWAEIRPALRDLLGTRIELRLGEPADSEIDRRIAAGVPRDKPGRGLSGDGRHMLIALPHTRLPDYGDRAAPPIRLLPAIVHRDTLTAADRPVLGVEDREFEAVTPDFVHQPHLLILGDAECGKTSTLRTLGRELTRTTTPAQARLIVVDYRLGLLGEVDAAHLAGYAAAPAALTALVAQLCGRLAQRLPGPDLTVTQLKNRSWWSGPHYYLLIDDYDLLTGDPLAPLTDYLPHAADIGLHLILARRSTGAARALYDPLLSGLREHGAMGLVMSAGPDEGPLLGGVRPTVLPPGRGTLITRAHGRQLIQVAWSL